VAVVDRFDCTDKKLLAAEGAAHFWLDKDFYYIDYCSDIFKRADIDCHLKLINLILPNNLRNPLYNFLELKIFNNKIFKRFFINMKIIRVLLNSLLLGQLGKKK
jgi:hypothetical protein